MDQQRLILLLQRYHNGSLSNEEHEELLFLTGEKEIEETLQLFASKLESESFVPYIFKEGEAAAQLRVILNSDIISEEPVTRNGRVAHRVHFLKTAWFRYAAAILIFIGIGSVIYLWNKQKDRPVITQTKPVPVKNDILPGSEKATLTLSNGEKIELNNTSSETINDGSLAIKNSNGQLIYASNGLPIPSRGGVAPGAGMPHRNNSDPGAGVGSGETLYNTMSTPRGGQYQLTLSDGTRVWLNAASSITYPTTFTGTTREIKITGEAYFEVAPNKSKPFIVKTATDKITVLGTSFNVNAYPDEPSVKTSLINGSINVNDTNIKPGHAFTRGKIIKTNTEQDIAWKNGVFDFDDKNLQQVLRQIARWYDVEIIYEKDVPNVEFIGEMSRSLQLNEVIEFLNGSRIKAKLEGRKFFISK